MISTRNPNPEFRLCTSKKVRDTVYGLSTENSHLIKKFLNTSETVIPLHIYNTFKQTTLHKQASIIAKFAEHHQAKWDYSDPILVASAAVEQVLTKTAETLFIKTVSRLKGISEHDVALITSLCQASFIDSYIKTFRTSQFYPFLLAKVELKIKAWIQQ